MSAGVTRPRPRDGAAVFALALMVRLAIVAWAAGRFPPVADGTYYHRLASRLAAGQGYTWLWPDGAVTYAAHYPVGYPALIAGPYAWFGASPSVAMVVAAVIGAMGAWASWRVAGELRRRGVALTAGVLVAVHPGLVGYTVAVMTEGITAALWVIAAAGVVMGRDARRPHRYAVAVGLCLGVATLVRPQSLLLAPLLGWLALRRASWRSRVLVAALVGGCTLAVCLPWTLRNCQRMGRCALVSVNGGWNLLIGTQPEDGGWAPLQVPDRCRGVYDEAQKDRCFGGVARRRIASAPGSWLALMPEKLAATFDVCAAPGWYLQTSNGEAFDAADRRRLSTVELGYERLLLLLALVGMGGLSRSRAARVVALVGAVSAVTVHATLAFVAVATLPLLSRRHRWVGCASTAGAVVMTALVHAVFFGGGRYQLVVWGLLGVPAAMGIVELDGCLRRRLQGHREGRADEQGDGRNGA